MTPEQVFLAGLLGAVFVFFVWGRWRYDIVALGALLIATIGGSVPFADAFSGFGHPATVTVAVVLVVSRALQNSGAVDVLVRHLAPVTRTTTSHVGAFAVVAGSLSAVMNNVGALALMMPAALQSAAKAGRPVALILMPLSFASILGGLVTLIGTPPNIIVAAFRADQTGEPFRMFDFSPVGGIVALVGILFVATVGWRLVPKERSATASPADLFAIETYVGEAEVPADHPAIGSTLAELDDQAAGHDAVILGLIRRGRRIDRASRRERIRAGDILVIEAGPEEMEAAVTALALTRVAAGDGKHKPLRDEDVALSEAVVQPHARIVGRMAGPLRLRPRFGVNLMAVARAGQPFRGRLRTFVFRPGDVLLLEGDPDRLPELVNWLGCLPLAERGLQTGLNRRAGLAVAIFAAAVAAATIGLISLPVALTVAAVVMVLANYVPVRELYDSIDWPVVVLLGAMIPVGRALETSGTTELVAGGLVDVAAGAPPIVLLGLVLVITMTLSDVMNNAATAVVMAPIAINIADRLGADPDAFLMAVAIGASCAFLTPIGHQNNTLILGPGGYHFGDYWRMGLPLEILITVVSLPLLMVFWPL